ncbi:MAG: hypothetical protein WDM96_17685 [Lacunisphaera sp.]
MILRRLFQLACVSLWLAVGARGEENLWPFYVGRSAEPPGPPQSGQYLGPLFFHQAGDPTEARGLRPLFLTTRTGDVVESNIIYPLFMWHREPGYRSFRLLSPDRTQIQCQRGGEVRRPLRHLAGLLLPACEASREFV